jgi:hypothetical protein
MRGFAVPNYPCPVRRVFEIGGEPVVGTPPDGPNPYWEKFMAECLGEPFPPQTPLPVAEFKEQLAAAGLTGLVAEGAYELEPTEFLPVGQFKPDEITVKGTLQLLPDAFETKNLFGDNVEDTLRKCMAAYEGQAITRQMIDKVTADVKAAIADGRVMPFPITFKPLDIDWKKEQQAIMEEQRFQAQMQAKIQEEMEQAGYHLKAMQEEADVDAEIARMVDDGCPQPHPESCDDKPFDPADPILTIPAGEFKARVRDMVRHRHPDPACHMTADLKARRLKEEFLRHHVPPPELPNFEVTLPEGGLHVRPDGPVYAFSAFETIGAAIPHAGTVVKTDDPELMKALGDAIEAGRVVMDGNTIVSIDGVPTTSDADFFRRRIMDGLGIPKTAFEDDVKPDAVVG